jgi:tripartite-type tricarboxylate transporter receptor subunit TctC
MLTRRQFNVGALCIAASALSGLTRAQSVDYPNRPVRIIVPFAAGGGPDVLARKMAVRLADVLGVPVVVDNIVGAGGILATQNVARMLPDGYNILLGSSAQVVQKAMEPTVKFDPVKDFVHVTRTAFSPSILVVSAESPYKSVEDLVSAARRQPGKLNYASGGVGSAAHLAAAAMVLQAKVEVTHVPYKGSAEIVPSILSGATQFAFPIASTAIPQIQGGKVRALAVTSQQRMSSLPNVPTLAEAFNAPDFVLDAWFGLWAPAATPSAIIDTLFKAVVKTYADAALRADSEAAGAPISLSASPAEFTKFVAAETVKFERIVKAAGLSVLR